MVHTSVCNFLISLQFMHFACCWICELEKKTFPIEKVWLFSLLIVHAHVQTSFARVTKWWTRIWMFESASTKYGEKTNNHPFPPPKKIHKDSSFPGFICIWGKFMSQDLWDFHCSRLTVAIVSLAMSYQNYGQKRVVSVIQQKQVFEMVIFVTILIFSGPWDGAWGVFGQFVDRSTCGAVNIFE